MPPSTSATRCAAARVQRKGPFLSAWAVAVVLAVVALLPLSSHALVVRCDTLGTTAYFTFLHSGARFGPQYVAPPGQDKGGKNSIFPWARSGDGESLLSVNFGGKAKNHRSLQELTLQGPSSAGDAPTAARQASAAKGASASAVVGAGSGAETAAVPEPGTFSNVSGALVLPEGDNNAYSCQPFSLSSGTGPAVVLAQRGKCFFIDKAVRAEAAGAGAVIVFDDEDAPLIIMSSQNSSEHVDIPAVFVSLNTGLELMALHGRCDSTSVVINGTGYLGGPGSNGEGIWRAQCICL